MTITSPGVYSIDEAYVAASPTDHAILIEPYVDNVSILLRSTIECPQEFATDRNNAAIRLQKNNNVNIIGMGGHVRGFGFGLLATECDGIRVEDFLVEHALMRGILVHGNDALIQRSFISNISGSTNDPAQFCIGIEIYGSHPKIIGCIVEDVYGSGMEPENGEGVGISISDYGVGGLMMANAVKNSRMQAKSYGYWIGGASDVKLVYNYAENFWRGAAASSPTSGLAKDNIFKNCDTGFYVTGNGWTAGDGKAVRPDKRME